MIVQDTINFLHSNHADYIGNLRIVDVRIGIFLTAVKLSDGSVGVSGTYSSSSNGIHCKKENRDFGDFTPSRITGKLVGDLFAYSKHSGQIISLQIAALNAISSKLIKNSGYKVLDQTDPISLIDFSVPKTITLVGAFQSYIRKISATKNCLYVLELDKNSLDESTGQFFTPAKDYQKVVPISDVVIITGQTLLNGTLDKLLEAAKPGAQVIVTGPSASLLPVVLFAKGVKIIGALQVTNPELLLKIAGEGGTAYHLFQYCAEKISILNEKSIYD